MNMPFDFTPSIIALGLDFAKMKSPATLISQLLAPLASPFFFNYPIIEAINLFIQAIKALEVLDLSLPHLKSPGTVID